MTMRPGEHFSPDNFLCQNNCSCNGPLERVKEVAPGTYTVAIMIGDDLDHDTTNSVFMSADNQVLEN